jgi:hypothetical protein
MTVAFAAETDAVPVCVKVIDDLKATYAQLQEESPKDKSLALAEKAVSKHCGKKLSTKDNKLVSGRVDTILPARES